MAALERPSYVQLWWGSLSKQCTRKCWSPSLDNLSEIIDKSHWPQELQPLARESWCKVGYAESTTETTVEAPISQ